MGLTPYGFLHSDICGSFRVCQSPQLFAAYRVLLRLLMPRHPPCALISLTFCWNYVWFQQKNLFLEIVFNPFHWIIYFGFFFLFVVSLFNFQRTFSPRRPLKPLGHFQLFAVFLVEIKGIEPLTPCLQSRCSPS